MIDVYLKKLIKIGWKQIEIAEKTGIHPVNLNRLVHGENCSIETAIKIADAFETTVDEVLGRSPAKMIMLEMELIAKIIDGDRDLAREVLRRAEVEKLILSQKGAQGRGKGRKVA